jgi:hypothetical protein
MAFRPHTPSAALPYFGHSCTGPGTHSASWRHIAALPSFSMMLRLRTGGSQTQVRTKEIPMIAAFFAFSGLLFALYLFDFATTREM